LDKKLSSSPDRLGAFLVGISLCLLYFLEPVFTHRKVSFPTLPATAVNSFPMDKALKVLVAGPFSQLRPGQTITLLELFNLKKRKPKSLLVNFWATWCDPCIEEIPSLSSLGFQLSSSEDNSLPQLITISVDEESVAVTKLLKTLSSPVNFTVLHDPDGSVARQLGTNRFPETFWVNSQGSLLYKWIGPQDWLSQEILQQLAS
jgi:thiol-disulfide isomerase/thioredoxin